MSSFIKYLVGFLLVFIKITKFLVIFIFKTLRQCSRPLAVIFKFFHFQIFLPFYRVYLFSLKKIGLSKSKQFHPINAILVNKNFTHVLLVVIALLIISENVMSSKDAIASEEVVGKTPLARLVVDELADYDEIIEEYQLETDVMPMTSGQGSRYDEILAPQTIITTNENVVDVSEEDYELLHGEIPLTEDDITPETPNTAKRTEIIEYTVQAGETASSIAQKFGISVNTILWENGLSAKSLIKPGDTLNILPFTGVRHKVKSGESLAFIAKYYEVDQSSLAEANNLTVNQGLKIGQQLLVPGGRQIVAGSTVKPTTPKSPSKPALVDANIELPSAKPVAGAKMNWPTNGHTITQYYSWRHNGVDIANKTGTPIYAADAGTIEKAQWNSGGYGYMILINHGGGKKTLYGHLSSFKVKAGDEVTKGEAIGAMGSTGRSTGPHLHFEVIIGGKRYNPLNYVSY